MSAGNSSFFSQWSVYHLFSTVSEFQKLCERLAKGLEEKPQPGPKYTNMYFYHWSFGNYGIGHVFLWRNLKVLIKGHDVSLILYRQMWFSKSPLHAFVAPTFTCMTPSCQAWRAETLWVMSLWELWRTLVRKWRTWRKVSNKTLLPAGIIFTSVVHMCDYFNLLSFQVEWVPRSSQIPILYCKTLYSNYIEWVIPSEVIIYALFHHDTLAATAFVSL